MRIACYTVARNEAHHARRWAETTEWADVRVVADTGSTDNTVGALRSERVLVVTATVAPFRFDVARTVALAAVPADVDVCLSLDMDELCAPDTRQMIEAAWEERPFGSALVWMDSGSDEHPLWWRAQRLHTRSGWRWVAPVHEALVSYGDVGPTVELPVRLFHRPDDRPRTSYLPLLEMAVTEEPGDARMWFYLARQHDLERHPEAALAAAETAVQIASPAPMRVVEAAACCRIAANAAPDRALAWLTRGVGIAPDQAEAWGALAEHYQARADWPAMLDACQHGLACPSASHHLADQGLRGWRLNHLAGLAAWADGDPATAVVYASEAVHYRREPWLVANLTEYRRADRPGVAVVIPVWNAWEHTARCLASLATLNDRDRIVVVDNGSSDGTARGLKDAISDGLPVTVIANDSNRGFAAACNQGAREASRAGFETVVFLNSDCVCPSGWAEDLLQTFHVAQVSNSDSSPVVAAGPTSDNVSGPQGRTGGPVNAADLDAHALAVRTNHLDEMIDVERLVGFCLAVRLDTFNSAGGFVEGWSMGGYDDDDLCRRLLPFGRLVIAEAAFVHHHGHATFDANGVDWYSEQETARPRYEAARGSTRASER